MNSFCSILVRRGKRSVACEWLVPDKPCQYGDRASRILNLHYLGSLRSWKLSWISLFESNTSAPPFLVNTISQAAIRRPGSCLAHSAFPRHDQSASDQRRLSAGGNTCPVQGVVCLCLIKSQIPSFDESPSSEPSAGAVHRIAV